MILFQREINNRKFMLVQNSIIEEKVEAIVNPANEHLAHGGGVAGLISRAGGPEIQRESSQKAPIDTGQATFTGAGTLPFKAVIHAVGPIYRDGSRGEPQLLESAVTSALKVAHQLQLKSVSLPSISTGIFGYPLEPAVKIIAKAIFDFLETESSLEEVHLCEFSADKAGEIKGILTE
ncbi:MAG: macro domain-containing protein [bacterium]|nr:macro domain-containing protein [bacterium]